MKQNRNQNHLFDQVVYNQLPNGSRRYPNEKQRDRVVSLQKPEHHKARGGRETRV